MPTTGRLALAVLVTVLTATAAIAKEQVLVRDSGRMESKQSSAGTGHVVAFETPSGKWWVKAIRVHGSRYGGGYDAAATSFRFAVCDESLRPIAEETASYERFSYGRFEWVEVPFATPVAAPRRFKIAVGFDPAATRGVFVAWAKTTESHSGYGLPGGRERPAEKDREWMIRVVLTDRPPKAGDTVELGHDDGEPTGQHSLGGSGHVVEFRKPTGTWWLKAIRIHGQRYGGGYDPAATPFRVSVCSTRMKTLHTQEGRYSLFGAKREWVDLPVAAALKAPSRFRICVDFAPTATRGVFVDYGAARVTRSWTGLPAATVRPWKKGAWMIHVVLTKAKPDLPEAKPPEPASYLDDLKFLERTVRDSFPALEKKGVDWPAVVEAWRPRFAKCQDDRTHVLNVRRLLATLGDSHTGVTNATVEAHSPAFAGLYGAGLWIATSPDDRRRIVRAIMPGHALASRIGPGSELVEIDGRPVAEVHEEVRARMREWSGWSSTHFLDARLSFQFFAYGKKRELSAKFLNPDGEIIEVGLPPWGPGGRGLSRAAASMPSGVEARDDVAGAMLDDEIGYLRILGGMSEATAGSFDSGLEPLLGAKGILLDCRGMGGGGDGPAWAMAGRFFEKSTPHGSAPPLRSEGRAFTGPVVMLQDEREISSAETFTWAMTETGRVVSVGRPTAGGTIIPRTFRLPSGIASFRMGCTDRRTPMRAVQPEGIGTPPDVLVPYEPHLLAGGEDPEIAVGLSVLRALVAGRPRKEVVAEHAELPRDERIDRFVGDEVRRVRVLGDRLPGREATAARLERLADAAKAAGRKEAERRAREALARIRDSD